LVPLVVDAMGRAFPELKKDPERVMRLIQEEEVGFGKTLDRGIELFQDAAEVAASKFSPVQLKQPIISAEDAFRLHDTYGFPIDLTRIMAEERAMSVDIAGYEKLMEEAKDRAR